MYDNPLSRKYRESLRAMLRRRTLNPVAARLVDQALHYSDQHPQQRERIEDQLAWRVVVLTSGQRSGILLYATARDKIVVLFDDGDIQSLDCEAHQTGVWCTRPPTAAKPCVPPSFSRPSWQNCHA